MKKTKIVLKYKFENLNDIIRTSRGNYRYANKVKREEMEYVKYMTLSTPKIRNYPVKMRFIWHITNKNSDIDNLVGKNIIDGLVNARILKNDNLGCIEEITYNAVVDNEKYVEIIIEEKEDYEN